jgi:hypothetical protein
MSGVPKATIRRHAMKKNSYVNGVKAVGRQAPFSRDIAKILADHNIMLESAFGGGGAGLSIKDYRNLASNLTEKHKLSFTFNNFTFFFYLKGPFS